MKRLIIILLLLPSLCMAQGNFFESHNTFQELDTILVIQSTTNMSSFSVEAMSTFISDPIYWFVKGSSESNFDISNTPSFVFSVSEPKTIVAMSRMGATNIQVVRVSSQLFNYIDLSRCTQLSELQINGNMQLYTLTMPVTTTLTQIRLSGATSLPIFSINSYSNLVHLNTNGNYTLTSGIPDIASIYLVKLDEFGKSNGFVDVSGMGSPLTSAGLSAKASLIAKGWLVAND